MHNPFPKYKTIIVSVSTYVWAAIIPSLITILINPFLAKNLSAQDYAIIGYYSSFNFIVLPVVTFSFINYYSRNFFLKSEEEKERLKNTLISASLIVGPILTAIVSGIFVFYARIQNISIPIYPYFLLSFIPNLFGYYFFFYQTELKMRSDVKKYFQVTLANALVFAFFSLLLVVVIKGEAVGRLTAILIANLLMAGYCITKMITKFHIDKKLLVECLKFSWPVVLSSILYYFISSVDKIYLEKQGDSEQFGLYNIATQIVNYVAVVSVAILQTFTPDIYKFTSTKQYKKLFKIAMVIFFAAVFINLAFIPFSKLIISLLTYGKFTEAYHYANILVLRNISYIAFFVLSDILIGLALTKLDFIIKLLGAISAVVIYHFSIKNFGFVGASWAQSVTLMIPVILGLFFIFSFKKVSFK